MTISVFERYPQLKTLKGLIPDEVVEKEVGSRADDFERLRSVAEKKIPSVRLCDVFPPELEKGSIQLQNFLGHWGNVSVEEVCKIALIARFLKPKKVFEFGTYNGMTTLQIALNTPAEAKVYTLDLPPGIANRTKFRLKGLDRLVSEEFRAKFHTGLGSYFKGHPVAGKIIQLLGDSATFDYSPFYGQIDLIFIDGAHDYENKKSDSENALKMVAPKGVILWHDAYAVVNYEVTKYLIELSDRLSLFHLRGTSLVAYLNRT